MKLAHGTIIRDYEIISLLGEGGMGEVYLAKESLLDRKVAIKRLNPILTDDKAFAERFVNEARIQAKLLHSNIVGLYNFFIDKGTYYMVLEYAEGINLRDLIAQTGPIVENRTLFIFKQIITALAYAHEKQIIHRDIKPSNIIISKGDRVKVLDFGIARLLSDQHLTRTGNKLGTLFYMSPEQVMGVKDIDHRSDIYSAGVVFFEMLSGRLPFDRNTDSDYVIQDTIVKHEVPDPRDFYPHISEPTITLLNRMCVKKRENRPSTGEIMEHIDHKPAFTTPIIHEPVKQDNRQANHLIMPSPEEDKPEPLSHAWVFHNDDAGKQFIPREKKEIYLTIGISLFILIFSLLLAMCS